MLKNQTDKTNSIYYILAVILPLVVLVCLGLYHLLSQAQAGVAVNSNEGVWDLCAYNLDEESVQLVGMVEVIPGALLTPKEFTQRQEDAVLLDVPFSEQYGTSRIRLLMPDNGWYTFTRTSMDYSTRLYVNGALLTEVGNPSDNMEDFIPNIGRITFTVQAVDGEIELVHQSANFVHRSGGYHGGWRVGGTWIAKVAVAADFAIVLGIGAYIVLFILHLILFMMMPGYKPNLYFALYCLTWCLRLGTSDKGIFYILIPALSWNFKFRMEYATVSIAILLTAFIIRDVFPSLMQRWAVRSCIIANSVFILFCIFLNQVLLTYVALFFLGLLLLVAIYIAVRLVVKLRKPKIDQTLILLGAVGVLLSGVRDTIFYGRYVVNNTLTYVETVKIAVLAFALLATTAFFIATMREVAAAKEKEQRLAVENAALSQINKLKSDMMASISHEIRTPLAVMSGYAQLSEQQLEDGSTNAETIVNLKVISREAQRLAQLAGGLLYSNQAEKNMHQREITALSSVIDNAAAIGKPILAKNNNRLRADIEKDLPLVYIGADMIVQVLLNMISNANRHMMDGEVVIAAYSSPDTAGFVTVTVTDSGSGISPEMLPFVFERGVGDRTGVGLAICKEIIEGYGGEISAENLQGNGTQLRFTLPVGEENDNE